MSDCSTEAMQPKEQSKACGTCSSYFVVRPTMKQGTCFYDELDEFGCAPLHDSDESCDKDSWEPRTETLEQRCQKLEQVAREMLHDFYRANNLSSKGHSVIALDLISKAVRCYKQELESLGVNVNE